MANPPGTPPPFTFEEKDVPEGRRIVLAGPDLPFGWPREQAAFDLGGALEHKKVLLPGRKTPIYQIQQATFNDLEIHGHFRDHLYAKFTGTVATTHARDMRVQIEEIRARANLLDIAWGDDRWVGLLIDAKFPVEGPHDITYILKFAIGESSDSTATPETTDFAETGATPVDLSSLVARSLQERQAEMLALTARATALQIRSTIENTIALALEAAQDLTLAAQTMQSASGRALTIASLRADGVARSLQAHSAELQNILATTKTADMVPDGDPADVTAWDHARCATQTDALNASGVARAVRQAARKNITSTRRLYVVKEGDTLESIARTQLGDASRASDLGIRQDQLKPGLVVRLPEAA